MNRKPKDFSKIIEDTINPQVLISELKHHLLALILLSLGLIILSSNDLIKDYINTSISIGIGTSLITAAAVDVIYNMILIKNIDLMVARNLMLRKEVQDEVLKEDKREEVLSNALEWKLGGDLKEAVENFIDKLDGFKYNGKLKVELKGFKKGSAELQKHFYQLNIIEECEEIINSNKMTVVATDNYDKYVSESKKPKEDTYLLFYLPSNLYLIEEEFFFETELIINNKPIPKKVLENSRIGTRNRFIKYEYEIGKDISRLAQIQLTTSTILSKMEHVFFWDLDKAFKRYDIDLDYNDTDIVKCEPYLPFQTYPLNEKFSSGRRIQISLMDWILPPCTMCFIWYCKNEIPENEIIQSEAESKTM